MNATAAMSVWSEAMEAVDAGVYEWIERREPNAINAGKPLMDVEDILGFELGYFAFIFFGTLVMKHVVDKPFDLFYFKVAHNAFLFGLSLYMLVECARTALGADYKLFGNPMEKGDEPHAKAMADVVYIFYVSKIWEFLDTVIMVLGKKFNQVSFLAVYHHSSIALIWFVIAKYAPGGDAYFSVCGTFDWMDGWRRRLTEAVWGRFWALRCSRLVAQKN